MTGNNIIPAKRLYQYIGKIETIFNIFAGAREEADAGLQLLVREKVLPLFADPSKVSFETKLVHIQDMDNFNKTAGWVKNPITFAVEPEKAEPKVEEMPKTEPLPPVLPDYDNLAKLLKDNGYYVKKKTTTKNKKMPEVQTQDDRQ